MVYEDGFIRTLRLGKEFEAGKQSRIDLRDPDNLILEYTRLIFAGLLINDKLDRVLIIGLGGGAIPRALNKYYPNAKIDVVDIDPEVLNVAEKYFLFKTGKNIRAHISDGRLFLQDKINSDPPVKYDMIVLDAFDSKTIPGHLLTREFLGQVAQNLDPKGVVVANVLSDNILFHSIIKTYRKVFGSCYVFMGGQVKNAVLVTPGRDALGLEQKEIIEKADFLKKKYNFNFSMASVARQFRYDYRPKRLSKVLSDSKKM